MIKRLLVAVLCMAVMFSGTMFVSASTDGYAIIDYVKMELGWKEVDDEYGYPYEIDVTDATFNLTNNCETVTQFAPMVAFYADDMLVDVVKAEAKTIEKGASGRFSVKSETAYNEDADSCKVFVLGENLVPYANVGTGIYNETVVSSSGAKLNNIGAGDLRISSNVGDGDVELLDVTIRGNLIVEGGGSESVKIEECDIFGKIVVNKESGETPRIELTNTPVEKIELKTPATIEVIDDSSAIQELVVTADAEIRGDDAQIGKIVIDETAGEKVELKVPATLQTEVEVNSVNGVDFGDADTGNITFSTTNVENADEIFNQIKDYTEHMHVWTEQEIALGYNMVECNGCDEGKNRAENVASFTFDRYISYDEDEKAIEYLSSDEARNPERAIINIGDEATDFILYNGSIEGSKDLDDYFCYGFIDEYIVGYSGKVTLIDNDGNDDYDVVCIEAPTYGVVDEVKDSGRLVFKNGPETIGGDRVAINFNDPEQTIYITKDGEEIDYTELQEWDVLSVLWNPSNEIYYVEVVNKVEGTINWRAASTTSATGYEYSINGEVYDVVCGAYECESLKPGAKGTFYIDDYGKIVAYRKFVSENYGYILNSCKMCDDWDNENVKLQMLASDGEVYEATLAERVKIEYPESVGLTAEDLGYWDYLEDSATYDIDDIDMDTFADAIRNQLIAYEMNSSGEVKTITFYQADEDEDSPLYYRNRCGENVTYNARYDSIKYSGGYEFDVTEDTIVFFINNAENNVYTYGEIDGVGSKKYSAVATKDKLSDSVTYDYGMFFNTQEDVAEIIVLYNTSIEVEGPDEEITSGNGYILNSCKMCDDWGNENVMLQILASDGEVYEATLAEDFTIANPQEAELEVNEKDMEAVTYAVRNKLIAYEMNTYGEIVTVTFCTGVAGQAEVNDGKTRITVGDNEYSLTEGTIVFFVNNSNGDVYDGDAVTGAGSKAYSTVATRDKLVSGATYDCGAIFNSQGGVAEAIVIYNTSIEVEEPDEEITSGNGYILNAVATEDNWGNPNLMMQMLASDGEVYEATLAERVKIEYPESVGLTAGELGVRELETSAVYDVWDIDMDTFADAVRNQLIAYEMNLYGQIKTITFAQTDEDEESSLYYRGVADTDAEYKEESGTFTVGGEEYMVTDDAIIFMVNMDPDDTWSTIGITNKTALAGLVYDAQLYNTHNGKTNMVVVKGVPRMMIAASSNIAVIDMVGEAFYNGEEVLYVRYYMGGELCEAYTDVNYVDDLYVAEPGDLYKFAFSADGEEIVSSICYGGYAIVDAGEIIVEVAETISNAEEQYFGPVVKCVPENNEIGIAPLDGEWGWDFIDYQKLNAEGANIYVYDTNKIKNGLRLGKVVDAHADENLINNAIYQQDGDDETIPGMIVTDAGMIVDDGPALGMMDFVVAIEYNGSIRDIVIYKGYDFGRYEIY